MYLIQNPFAAPLLGPREGLGISIWSIYVPRQKLDAYDLENMPQALETGPYSCNTVHIACVTAYFASPMITLLLPRGNHMSTGPSTGSTGKIKVTC